MENQYISFNFQYDIFATTAAICFTQIRAVELNAEKLNQKGFVEEDSVLWWNEVCSLNHFEQLFNLIFQDQPF